MAKPHGKCLRKLSPPPSTSLDIFSAPYKIPWLRAFHLHGTTAARVSFKVMSVDFARVPCIMHGAHVYAHQPTLPRLASGANLCASHLSTKNWRPKFILTGTVMHNRNSISQDGCKPRTCTILSQCQSLTCSHIRTIPLLQTPSEQAPTRAGLRRLAQVTNYSDTCPTDRTLYFMYEHRM